MAAILGRRQLVAAIIVRTPLFPAASGDATAAGTAAADASGTSTDPARPAGPSIVGAAARDAAYRARLAYDPVLLVVPPVAATAPVTSGDAAGSGTATASAAGSATAPTPAPARPLVVSDPHGVTRWRTAYDPVALVIPPLMTVSLAGDAAAAATAGADATGSAASPATAPTRLFVVSDPSGPAYRARLAYDPVTVIVAPLAVTTASGSATGAGTAAAVASGAVTGPSSVPLPPVVLYRAAVERAWWARQATDATTLVIGQVDPDPVIGAATGAAAATATANGSRGDTGQATAAATAAAAAAGSASSPGATSGNATAPAAAGVTATGSAVTPGSGAALGAATANASASGTAGSPGNATGAASATATASGTVGGQPASGITYAAPGHRQGRTLVTTGQGRTYRR